ncbi:hypothetical protein DSO57_1025001 [Entomophthora muscae]|uniref:Uncharacterized protein n=1 Tax=Entomophthora muscae TaxID=34485 RepID=A0ACC2U0Z4_9FUNG|nr:hypothetical protein DSO57_1025001 [Entomophthora muscae]
MQGQDLLISGEYLVKSLTCNNLDPLLLDLPPRASRREDPLVLALLAEDPQPISWATPAPQGYSIQHNPWMLAEMSLMGFDSVRDPLGREQVP